MSQNGYGARSCLIRAILTFMDPANLQADSILRSPQAVPHASTNRALCRLSSEVSSDPAFSDTAWPSAKPLICPSFFELLHRRFCPVKLSKTSSSASPHLHSCFQFIQLISSRLAQRLACWAHTPKVRGSKPRSAISARALAQTPRKMDTFATNHMQIQSGILQD